MTCHHYKQALLELAAAGPETNPDPKLQAHLQSCSSCRSAFENERSLFASIDSCLRSSANAEIPSSFIPAVRAQLQRESPAAQEAPITNPLLWLPAIAAAAIILFIFASQYRRVKSQPTAEHFATERTESPVATATTAASPSQATTAPITAAVGKRFATKAIIMPDKNPVRASSGDPEILVPPDQEILLARYADQFRRHHQSSATLLTEVTPDQRDQLQVPLIQIAELNVKPLAPEQKNDQKYDQESDIREK
ncbi:MAG: hypothetical protein QOG55_3209 [Acidobacteriaceae bacterium]|nr:hypothetical protein [Acidobacteriaceae bacterium]